MGLYIHESPRYKGSNLDKLEDILVDAQDGIRRHVKIRPGMDRLELAKTFIALVSPSLTGKTQSVFVMKRVRALYFCFQNVQSINNSQQVYQMFNNFSNMFYDLADLDMNSLSRNFTSRLQEAYQQENSITGGNRTSKTFNGIFL